MTGEKLPAAKTEEQICTYTVGELRPLTSPIIVADYDPEWPLWFEVEAARIRANIPAEVKPSNTRARRPSLSCWRSRPSIS